MLTQDIIAEENRETFVDLVFSNLAEIESINSELSRALDQRQSEAYLVPNIGDIMLQHVGNFEPFVRYGANQVIGKFYFELEKKRNPRFAKFVEVRNNSVFTSRGDKNFFYEIGNRKETSIAQIGVKWLSHKTNNSIGSI